jgi:hypothetical protein
MFIGLVRDRDADTMTPQISSDFTATIGLVTHHATRSSFWTPSAGSLHCTSGHEQFKSKGFVPLARAQLEGHQVVLVCRSHMPFGAETALASAKGFGVGPSGRARCMLVGSNDRAIDVMNRPVDLAIGIGLLLHRLKETLPETGFSPAIEAAGHGAPSPLALRQITPRGTGTQHPQDAVEDASMIRSGSTRLRFLRRKQRLREEAFAQGIGPSTLARMLVKKGLRTL